MAGWERDARAREEPRARGVAWGHVGKDGPSEADGAISAVAKREA